MIKAKVQAEKIYKDFKAKLSRLERERDKKIMAIIKILENTQLAKVRNSLKVGK